jgi:transposase InsO family protein
MKERTTSHAQRVAMIEQHLQGQSLASIAQKMQLNRYTVRHWWRCYEQQAWRGLLARSTGRPSTGQLSSFEPMVKYVALRLKREHPGWGLDVLRLEMSRRPSLVGKQLPSRTALYNYLQPFYARLRPGRRLPSQKPQTVVREITRVHQRWQMDFKGKETIVPEGQVSPWLVCDEFSSAPLASVIYTKRTGDPKAGLTLRDIQANLRTVFNQWGLPDQLRMDRDPLWVGSSRLEWPSTLILWLVGLGVEPIINRPGQPTDNAQVERLNRTWQQHVALGAAGSTKAQLQTQTDQAWLDRRQFLPSRNRHCAGLPPLLACPELTSPRRPYTPAQEPSLFQMDRVYDYLSQWQWQRKVDQTGSISMADFNRRVSLQHVGQIVKVRFDKQTLQFAAYAVDGTYLNAFTVPVISETYILGLTGYDFSEPS